MKNLNIVLALISILSSIISCNKDDNGSKTKEIQVKKLSGYIQKGPFLNGTSVNLSELDNELKQTGLLFSSQVINNSGNFVFDDIKLTSSVVLLNANGFYFNEVKGENSSATLTLTAMVDIEDKDQINVNVLTHLQKSRIEVLMDNGVAFQQATDSTQRELFRVFGVTNENVVTSDQLNMFVDSDDNAILIALSIIMQGDKAVSDFSEFLANINLDFSDDGQIQNESIKAELYRSAQNLNLEAIKAHLEERYESLGFNTQVPNFQEVVNNFLTSKAPFEIEYDVENASCDGNSDGKIDLTISGEGAPFEFNWSNGEETEDLDNIPVGTYFVTVTDKNENSITVNNINVTSPEELIVSSEITNSGLNQNNGAINLTVNGGQEPYSFEWSNDQTTEDLNNLDKGIYNVTITDANGCSLNTELIVQEEIELVLEISSTPCYAGATGAIDLTVIGGLPPYSFEWSNGSNSEDADGLQSGTYSVTVTDQLDFTTTTEIVLDQYPEIIVDYQINRPTPGLSDGSVTLTVQGGLPPYQYQWSDNSSNSQINSISSGEYSVTVTDANSCTTNLAVPVYGEFVDNRDNISYKTIQVGSQIWFAENLRSKFDNLGNDISYYCISDLEPNCDTLGHMYTFEVSQTACPQGWRMPVEADWQELELYLGIPQSQVDTYGVRGTNVGTRLKEGGDSLLEIKLTGAILGPNTPSGGSTQFVNESSIFWSNTMVSGTNAIIRSLDYNETGIYRSDIEIDHFATCLRCIKE